ncbi:hypothetical protein FRC03_005754 [Tulasnella sp. 419]|nr:hypothetical protein FRC03_005754 [Tulasnella sp. 419]
MQRVVSESSDYSYSIGNGASYRVFRDPVHDMIQFDELTCAFIDTPQFQRLRYLKQLGTSYFVFLGASHNRLEHSIGTAHLARRLVKRLKKAQPELGITHRDVKCVELAGLCHDLGHGPFSHVFDGHFIPAVKGPRADGTFWCHEEASEMMLDALVKENEIDIPEDWVRFIKDLIRGEPRLSIHHDPPEKRFLFEIVSNKRNGIDVDKWDYLARDCKMIGETCTLVASRLLDSARVIGDLIAYKWKDSQSVMEMFQSRYSLHKRIYNHSAAKGIEYMIVEALIAAEPVYQLSDAIEDPKKYLHITDSILEEIERKIDDPRLEKSQRILRNLRKRLIPCRVEEKCLPSDYVHLNLWKEKLTPEAVAQASAEIIKENQEAEAQILATVIEDIEDEEMTAKDDRTDDFGPLLPPFEGFKKNGSRATSSSDVAPDEHPLSEEEVIIDFSVLHFGMKDKDPLQLVQFYGKHKPDEISYTRLDESGYLRPMRFQEVIVRCFAKDKRKRHQVQAAFRRIMESLPSDLPTNYPTTPTEAPSTPVGTTMVQLPGEASNLQTAKPPRSKATTPFATIPNTFTTLPVPPRSPSSPSRANHKRKKSDYSGLNVKENTPSDDGSRKKVKRGD